MFYLHMIPQSVSTDDVRSDIKSGVMSIDNRTLYFRVFGDENNGKLTVDGGGVNAIAFYADIGATNGIIHIIDSVLGMPFPNIYDKLQTDPDLSFTFELSLDGHPNWNDKLKRVDRRYTYFVPSNDAWQRVGREYPIHYKQLKQNDYPSQTRMFLDRCLVKNEAISCEQLNGLSEVYTAISMLFVNFRISKQNATFIEWEGIRARIIRPDIQASNGVIHVIDTVFLMDRNLPAYYDTDSESRMNLSVDLSHISKALKIFRKLFTRTIRKLILK